MSAPKPTGRALNDAITSDLNRCPFCRHRDLAFSGSKIGVFIEGWNCLVRGPLAANWQWAKRKWNDQVLAA